MMELEYFKINEFDSPDVINSGRRMNEDFLDKLDLARKIAGIPFKITSGYRTKLHNERVGGVEDSSHIKGLASDISCRNSLDRFIIINALMLAGFNRIGIANTFIHVDSDTSKPQNVIWTY